VRSSTRVSMNSPSSDRSRKGSEDTNRKGGQHGIKRTTSAQCGSAKRNGLLHRESDPEMTMVTNKGGTSKEA
jgi:hypothetical protein